MKKVIFLILFFLLPWPILADQTTVHEKDNIFTAEVVEVLREENLTLSDGTQSRQQNLRLRGLDGGMENKVFEFNGLGNYDVISKNIYAKGDRVVVEENYNDRGAAEYYVTDYVRTRSLAWLFVVFVLSILAVGRMKGVRSVLSLFATFFVIMKLIVPGIIAGFNPLLVTLAGGLLIFVIIVYLTEGINKSAHVAVASIFLSLLLTVFLSWLFVVLARLSGFASEEAAFIINIGKEQINFQGLLLAGMVIGALGVLDDVVISQIAAVEEINRANTGMDKKELWQKSLRVGVSHISSMTNTLFLAYAGASLPLLILFTSGQSAFANLTTALNNENLATEIVRTLTGSIGLIMAVPISTALAVWLIKKNQ